MIKALSLTVQFTFLSVFMMLYLLTTPLASAESKKLSSSKKEGGKMMKTEVAILAGGCFWGVEELIRKLEGVTETEVGYTGGVLPNPTYNDVKKGTTGHAEAIRVTFDPGKLSYENLLKYFFRLHDPTTLNQQGNDRGTQYRSAIYFTTVEQKDTAERVKEDVNKSKKWSKPIVTEITKAQTFYSAETYHQDYLQKNPGGYTCHFLRD